MAVTSPSTSPSTHDDMLDHATALLHARGERMTGPRRAVLVTLAERGGHVSAEQVVSDVAALDVTVHRASVYRTLEALSTCGLVQHVHLGHGATAYHLVDAAHPHAHCTSCGAVVDLPTDLLDVLGRSLHDQSGFVLDPVHVALSGTCRDCAARSNDRR